MDAGLAVGVGAAGLYGILSGAVRGRPSPPALAPLPMILRAAPGEKVLKGLMLAMFIVVTPIMAVDPLTGKGVMPLFVAIEAFVLIGIIETFRRRLEVTQEGVRVRRLWTGPLVPWPSLSRVRYVGRSFFLYSNGRLRAVVPTRFKGIENFVAALTQLGHAPAADEAVKGYLSSVNR